MNFIYSFVGFNLFLSIYYLMNFYRRFTGIVFLIGVHFQRIYNSFHSLQNKIPPFILGNNKK